MLTAEEPKPEVEEKPDFIIEDLNPTSDKLSEAIDNPSIETVSALMKQLEGENSSDKFHLKKVISAILTASKLSLVLKQFEPVFKRYSPNPKDILDILDTIEISEPFAVEFFKDLTNSSIIGKLDISNYGFLNDSLF